MVSDSLSDSKIMAMTKQKLGDTPKHCIRVGNDLWQSLDTERSDRTWHEYLGELYKKGKSTVRQSVRQEVVSSQGNKILDIFYEINKTIDYKKPFERRAADELIKLYGLERVQKVAEFACKVRGMPYAPRISKPSELKEKWANLEAFALEKKTLFMPPKSID